MFILFCSMFLKLPFNWVILNLGVDFFVLVIVSMPLMPVLEIIISLIPRNPLYPYYISLFVLALELLYVIIGTINGLHIHVKTIPVYTNKLSSSLSIVQISDIHLGTHRVASVKSLVNKINSLQPDIVCITGDLLDSANVLQLLPLSHKNAATSLRVDIHEDKKQGVPSHLVPSKYLEPLNDIRSKYGVYFVSVCLPNSILISSSTLL